MQYQDRPLPFKRSRTTISIEEVDESWALELINEAEREDHIRVEDSDVESVRLECCKEISPDQTLIAPVEMIGTVELADTIELVEVKKPVLEVVSGPSAIDIQKMQWSSRSQQCAITPNSSAKPSNYTQSSMFKSLLKRWMHA